jgi:hypothetical protein
MKPRGNLPSPPINYRMMQAVMYPILKLLGLCSRSAFNLCSTQMDRELTKRESLRLRVHLSMCGLCSRLPAQFRGMRSLINACECDHSQDEASEDSMTTEAKRRWPRHGARQAMRYLR